MPPLNDIIFSVADGGLGRRDAGDDHVSGLLFYGTKPGDFGADNVKKVRSLKQAEDFGLKGASYLVENYHIKEFFRINPGADLYIGMYAVPEDDAYTFVEIEAMQTIAEGKIRQIGVFITFDYASSQVTTLQTIATTLRGKKTPLSILYAADMTGVVDLTTLANIRSLTAAAVSVVISEDGAGAGRALANSKAYSITTLGATLGAMSKASVHESIAWVERFPMQSTDGELDVLAFANGQLYSTISDADLAELNDLGYIFMRKIANLDGSFHNDSHTAITITSDFAYIENVRTIDKAIREVYKSVIPRLNSPLYTNPQTGQMTYTVASALEALAQKPLNVMIEDGEISGARAIVDPDQDVNSTSGVTFNLKLVPAGVMRKAVINIGFTVQI